MSDNQGITYKGSCLCGSIQYEVNELEPHMAHCHCSMCRKFHGAAFATFGEAKMENFRWIRGIDYLTAYVASNGTTRSCGKNCGSSMTFKPKNGAEDIIEFSLGTLDSDIVQRPDAHIFFGSKANWVQVVDNLPKYVEGRGSEKER